VWLGCGWINPVPSRGQVVTSHVCVCVCVPLDRNDCPIMQFVWLIDRLIIWLFRCSFICLVMWSLALREERVALFENKAFKGNVWTTQR
jgi:hypothetical protein